MNEYGESEPDDIRLGACSRVSRMEYEHLPDRVRAMHEEKLRRMIAGRIVHDRSEVTTDEFYHEMRMDLYVATPEQFWKIVRDEAQKIATRYGFRMDHHA